MVEQLAQTFGSAPHVIVTSFRGLSVNQANALRGKIRSVGGRYEVVKNRLAKRAASGTPMERLVPALTGPCAIVVHDSDPVVLAKTLSEFAKENPQVEVLAGLVDAQDLLDVRGVKQLASLPGLDELRAQLLCLIQTPASQLVRLLNTPSTQVARAIDARREQLQGGS
jgi:large subunit ribosomal protein L10